MPNSGSTRGNKPPHHHIHSPHHHQPRPAVDLPYGKRELAGTPQSRYVDMLLLTDQMPRAHNILACFFAWLLLAGFLAFPGTFASVETAATLNGGGSAVPGIGTNATAAAAAAEAQLQAVATVELAAGFRALPLLIVGAATSGIGVLGMAWLYAVHRRNYVWLVGKLFISGATNAAAGLVSTLAGVYASQHGEWGATARAAGTAEAACLALFGSLFVLYNFVLLREVRDQHQAAHGTGSPRFL